MAERERTRRCICQLRTSLGGVRDVVLHALNRYQSGLRVNEALATATILGGGGGGTLGLSISAERLSFQPFVRGQVGRMQSGDQRLDISGLAGGLTIGSRM